MPAGGFAQSIDGPAQSWRYFAADAVDNPQKGIACITNGTEWAIAVNVADDEACTLKIVGRSTTKNAYLTDPAEGSTLDLRGTVFGADESETWTITAIDENALGADETRNTATAVVTPGTLVGNVERWFRCATREANRDVYKSSYTSITIDEPNITGHLANHLTPLTESAIVWSIRVPGATSVWEWALSEDNNASFPASSGSFAEDSFLSVRKVLGNAMGKRKWSGLLNLPVVEEIGAYAIGGMYPGYQDIRLGAEARSVMKVGVGACGWLDSGPTNLVVGFAVGNTVANQAFYCLPNLRRVEFTGAPPNFAANATSVFMGGDGKENEKAVTFIVPPSAAWVEFLAPFEASGDFVRWTGNQIRSYREENPEGPIVIGTVSKYVFRSSQTQYLAVSDRASAWVGAFDFDAAQGSVETGEFVIDDTAPFNVALRLTARPAEGATFAGWYGDVPDGKCADATLVVREADPFHANWVFVRFTRPWTLTADDADATKAVLDNGHFKIQATVDPETRNLTLGRGTACSLYAPDNTGDGILDLGGAITDADGDVYQIVSLGTKKSVLSSSANDAVPGARTLVTPGTLTAVEAGQLFHASDKTARATYETVVFDEPTATGGPCSWFFADQKNLRHVVFRCPSWTLPNTLNGMFYNTRVSETDVGWWKLDGVKTFGVGADNNINEDAKVNGTKARLRGSLKLPATTVVSPCAFQDNMLDEVWLGYGTANARVTNIQSNAFDNAGITNLVLNAARNLTVGENAFAKTGLLKTVMFLRYVVSADAFAAILACATAEAPAVVYAPKAYGWGQAAYLDAPTEEELSAAPAGETVLGVWRGADGVRAWVCHRDGPFPFKGMQLIVR